MPAYSVCLYVCMGNIQLLCISFCGAVVTLDALIILHARSFIANPPLGSFFASLLKQRAHCLRKTTKENS